MFHVNEIRELIKMVDRSSIDELTIKNDANGQITIKKSYGDTTSIQQLELKKEVLQPAVVLDKHDVKNETVETQAKTIEDSLTKEAIIQQQHVHKVLSPMVGIFYSTPSPEADPYVKVGDQVEENTVVCIVEAMKLFNEIEAEVKGEILEILVKNGELVEYGQPMFLVKKL